MEALEGLTKENLNQFLKEANLGVAGALFDREKIPLKMKITAFFYFFECSLKDTLPVKICETKILDLHLLRETTSIPDLFIRESLPPPSPPRPPHGVLLGSGNDARISEDKSNRTRYPFLVSSYASFTYGFFIYTSSSSNECANQTSRVFVVVVVVAFCLYQLEERTGRRNLAAKCFTCTRKLATFLLMN